MRRAVALLALLVATALANASCGERVVDVTLSFYDDGSGPHGFLCHDATHHGLANRIVGARKLSAVVDLFRLGGSPICSSVALSEWCSGHSCALLLDRRVCFDLPIAFLEHTEGVSAADQVRSGLAELKSRLVTSEPPAEVVLVRVVAMASTCADVSAHGAVLDCAKLVGCTKSCPVSLNEPGTVQLDLDTPGGTCDERDVDICAAPTLTEAQGACPAAP